MIFLRQGLSAMSKNWMRFSLFSILFILVFSWVNSAVKSGSAVWKSFYQLPHDSLDVLFLGNSHNFATFQPQVIDDILPINSFTVGTSGESIVLSYYELRNILKTQKPKLVVLETFSLDLTDMQNPAYIFEFLDAYRWDLDRSAVAARFLSLEKMPSIFPIFRTRIDWNDPGEFFNRLFHPFSQTTDAQIDLQRGFIPDAKVIPIEQYLSAHELAQPVNDQPLTENEIYLDKLYALCKEHNIQLVLTTAPVVKISGDQFQYYSSFDAIAFTQKNHLDLITFDSSDFSSLQFSNLTHVSPFGSMITTLELAEIISLKLDLPMDQEKLQYYRSFLFSDYSISHSDNDYVLTLIPKNEDLTLDYRFSIIEVASEKTMIISDWQRNSDFQFTLKKSGDYKIKVELRNLSGDYSMSADFSVNHEAQ